MALPTSSFRAPAEHHALVHAIARALRRRPDLAEPLRLLLAQVADTDAPAEPLPDLAGLVQRMEAVEQRVAEHDALLAMRPLSAPQAEGAPAAMHAIQPALPAPAALAESDAAATRALQSALQIPPAAPLLPGCASEAPAEPWTTGTGRMKRLTPAGLAELDRRLGAGEPDNAISAALGVSTTTVGKRRAAAGGAA